MAGAAGCVSCRSPAIGRAGRASDAHSAAGSLVLRRMDCRGPCTGQEARHQERHRRPAPAGPSFGGWCLGLHNEGVENFPCAVLPFLVTRRGNMAKSKLGRGRGTGISPVDVHVGARLRVRRTLLGMSQTTLGEAIGLSSQQMQKYEKGTNRISASRLFDLCRVLDVPIEYFSMTCLPRSRPARRPKAATRRKSRRVMSPIPSDRPSRSGKKVSRRRHPAPTTPSAYPKRTSREMKPASV